MAARLRSLTLAPLLVLGTVAGAQQPRVAVGGSTAFIGVNVVPMDRPEVLRAQTVVVADGRIVYVGPAARTSLKRGVARINGGGRYLLPGLIELDGHFPDPREPYETDDVLLMYLAHGVTSVRGSITHPSQADLQTGLEAGRSLGPRLVPGPPVGGAAAGAVGTAAAAPAWAHEALLSPLGATGSPYQLLRMVTADAAAALGLTDGTGVLATGARADLLLLDGNPLENLAALDRLTGVMLRGRWVPAEELVKRIQGRAKGVVTGYYDELASRYSLTPEFCLGTATRDCFGGDPDCGARAICASDFIFPRRAVLLQKLEFLAAAFPSSDWIVGQAVNFAAKQRAFERAVTIADGCHGTLWWCQALRGYSRHLRVQGSGHEQLDSALANAPFVGASLRPVPAWASPPVPSAGDRGVHCEWTDLQYLIPFAMRTEYERLACGVEGEFHQRFWWLADPLWSVPGNERRDEHFARNVEMRLHDEILRLEKYVPGRRSGRGRFTSDFHPQWHHAQVIPTGSPNSWRPLTGDAAAAQRAREYGGAYVNGGYSFVPDEGRLRDPLSSTADDWALQWNVGHERMVTREPWYGLEEQFVMLRRGDRLLALAAARLPAAADSSRALSATLALGRPADLYMELAPAHIGTDGVARASANLADSGWVASFEVVGDSVRRRIRFGAPAPQLRAGFGMSDPVLVDEHFEPERRPLLDAMLPSMGLSAGPHAGIYLEIYGVKADEPLQLSLSAKWADPSLLQRVAGVIGLAAIPLRASWVEMAELAAGNVVQRYIAVDLSTLEPGPYRLIVSAGRADGTRAEASRLIRILPPAR